MDRLLLPTEGRHMLSRDTSDSEWAKARRESSVQGLKTTVVLFCLGFNHFLRRLWQIFDKATYENYHHHRYPRQI